MHVDAGGCIKPLAIDRFHFGTDTLIRYTALARRKRLHVLGRQQPADRTRLQNQGGVYMAAGSDGLQALQGFRMPMRRSPARGAARERVRAWGLR